MMTGASRRRRELSLRVRGLDSIRTAYTRRHLYAGRTVTVEWLRRLRDTQTFPSRQALVDQIERDAVAARAILKGRDSNMRTIRTRLLTIGALLVLAVWQLIPSNVTSGCATR